MKASGENEALKVKIREEEYQVRELEKELKLNTDTPHSKKKFQQSGEQEQDEDVNIDELINEFKFIGRLAEGDIKKALDEMEKRLEKLNYEYNQIKEQDEESFKKLGKKFN